MIQVMLPAHLRTLAGTGEMVDIDVQGNVTVRSIVSGVESRFPNLRGTIWDRATQKRRPLVRFFACGEDVSHMDPDAALAPQIASGSEPFLIVGAIAGG